MSTKDFTANVISATKVVPDGNFKDSKASGIWDINEALDLIKGGNWPNAANINPSAFVDGLFQTHLYTGNGAVLDVTNNVDLTKGGLVWIKNRETTGTHLLWSSETIGNLNSTNDDALNNTSLQPTFNNDGFTFPSSDWVSLNESNDTYVSWTFRKQPKFFDIVTYTGDGDDTGRTISHNLGSVPGMMLVKRTSSSFKWTVYHRSNTAAPETDVLHLNLTDATSDLGSAWYDTVPTSSVFTVGDQLGVNNNGQTYIAYLFAHNNDDGGFGEPGDQDIIKCGGYTGNGNSNGTVVTLGFEPQFIMLKRTDATENANWYVFDSMRGIVTGGDDPYLYWNKTAAEVAGNAIEVTPTGFQLKDTGTGFNGSNATYIYMAIRRGGMQTPTAASSVFAIDTAAGTSPSPPHFNSGFPVDFEFYRDTDGAADWYAGSRLTGTKYLRTNTTDAEQNDNSLLFDYQNGFYNASYTDATTQAWMWKRARGYFDVSTYVGDGATNHNVSHNLGVSPEMIWIKNRGDSTNWVVWHKNLSSGKYLRLETTAAELNQSGILGTASVGATTFPVGSNSDNTNKSSNNYISYLFATVAGVSKVGTYSGTGSSQNIDCGFTAGSSFVLVKRYDGTDSWYIADSTRGISSGQTDKIIKLNSTDAEFTESDNSADYIAPHASGFNLPASSPFNGNGDDFIFYAIAAIS